jgi:hypothetical protein
MTLQTTITPNDDYVGSTLTVTHNGEEIFQMNDNHIEPEDATFKRDLDALVSMIRKAYQLGLEDGGRNVLANQ